MDNHKSNAQITEDGGSVDGSLSESQSQTQSAPVRIAGGIQNLVSTPANPLLPKPLQPERRGPPSCPLKDIEFVQLQKFKKVEEPEPVKMGEGFD